MVVNMFIAKTNLQVTTEDPLAPRQTGWPKLGRLVGGGEDETTYKSIQVA